jgi:hypothetical protein
MAKSGKPDLASAIRNPGKHGKAYASRFWIPGSMRSASPRNDNVKRFFNKHV